MEYLPYQLVQDFVHQQYQFPISQIINSRFHRWASHIITFQLATVFFCVETKTHYTFCRLSAENAPKRLQWVSEIYIIIKPTTFPPTDLPNGSPQRISQGWPLKTWQPFLQVEKQLTELKADNSIGESRVNHGFSHQI